MRVDATKITLISLRLIQQGTQREALTKFYQIPKVPSIENENNTYSIFEQKKIEIDMGLLNSLGQNYNEKNYK